MFSEIESSFPPEVLDRLHQINANADQINARVAEINRLVPGIQRKGLIVQAARSTTNAKRMFWLRREADLVSNAAMPLSACKSGCSSCCHIGVMMLGSEARLIGQEIGRRPATPPPGKYVTTSLDQDEDQFANAREALASEFTGVPCTFLDAAGKCSIYEQRPLACRLQLNMDSDDLLCRLVPGAAVPVPYLNVSDSKLAYVALQGEHNTMADIRHFFPSDTAAQGS
jgi:Fe-S-cluster containining protein